MSKNNLSEYLLLLVIIVISFYLRLYKIDNPIADWHSWRQADTSAVSRNFIKYGYTIFTPRYDDISNIQTGKQNPNGYRMVEFPLYNVIQALMTETFPQKSLEWWGRMVSIIFSLGSIIFLYLTVRMFCGRTLALLSSLFMGILPYSVYYSRVILPEPLMIFSSLGMIYFFVRWVERESKVSSIVSLTFASIALLIKPITIFLFLPLLYLAWHKWRFGVFKKIFVYFYFLVAIIPFVIWRVWVNQYPEGIPAFTWLLNDQNIRFKGAFFRWIFGERLGKLILGDWGLVLLGLGIISKIEKKAGWFFLVWFLSILIYFTVFAGGNVRHDYYQVLSIPIVSILLAKGIYSLVDRSADIFTILNRGIVIVVSVFFMISFSWYEVRGYFNINHPEIVEAGKKADQLLPHSARVIAPYQGDTAFLYQTNRAGWPVITDSVDNMIKLLGATAYVSVNDDEGTRNIAAKYKILWQEKSFIIVDLTSKR